MRTAIIHYDDTIAGRLYETEDGYRFEYDKDYLTQGQPISVTLPLQTQSFESKLLFPFFDGLIPEGWLLDIGVNNWKLNSKDRMGLLLTLCKDCLGAVS